MPSARPSSADDARRTKLRLADLSMKGGRKFDVTPDAETCARLAASLGLLDLDTLRLAGEIRPAEGDGWNLTARLTATVVQPCVVTLEPVTSAIDEEVLRHYRPHLPDETATGEVEMPEDEALEPLPGVIDLEDVLGEALALALPVYPRAEAAQLGQSAFTEPGKDPMTDKDAHPFAGLAGLQRRLSEDEG